MKLTSNVNYTFSRARQDGHYNDSTVIHVNHRKAKFQAFLGCGDRDDISVFRDSDYNIYVYCENSSLDYCGLEVFDSDGELINDLFIQNTDELYFNPFNFSDMYCVKVLANNYMY